MGNITAAALIPYSVLFAQNAKKGEKVAPLPSKQTETSPRRHTPKNVSAEVMLDESDVRGYTECTGLS